MKLFVPILNPFNLVDKNRELPAQYNFRHFDEFTSNEQITEFEQYKCYKQKWQKSDTPPLQLKADFGPINWQVRNDKGLVIAGDLMNEVAAIGVYTYYQSQIPFAAFDEGYYTLEILGGDPALITLVSEQLYVAEEHPGTVLVSYSHKSNNEILWETGIEMQIRVDGVIPFDAPDSVRTVYVDQPGSETTVKGDAFRKFKWYVGTDEGMPNWIIDTLEEIIDQNNLFIDGKGFAPVSGAKWNGKKIERYPWAQWNIEMRETLNRRSKIFEPSGLQAKKVVIEYFVDTALFGPIQGGGTGGDYYIQKLD